MKKNKLNPISIYLIISISIISILIISYVYIIKKLPIEYVGVLAILLVINIIFLFRLNIGKNKVLGIFISFIFLIIYILTTIYLVRNGL